MNKDTIKGKAKQVAGKAQSAFGDATNNRSQQAKGEAKKVAGKVQEGYGKAKDAVK